MNNIFSVQTHESSLNDAHPKKKKSYEFLHEIKLKYLSLNYN